MATPTHCLECPHSAELHLPDAEPDGPRACEGNDGRCNCHRDRLHIDAVHCQRCGRYLPHGCGRPCFVCDCAQPLTDCGNCLHRRGLLFPKCDHPSRIEPVDVTSEGARDDCPLRGLRPDMEAQR